MVYIFIFSLLNSIGTTVMWLMLGPYYSRMADGLASMGVIGMTRQFAFVTGCILAGVWADEGRPLIKNVALEVLQALFGCILLLILVIHADTAASLYPLWACVRFGLGGAAFVLSFKIMSFSKQSLGQSAIIHLLSTQGAALFGAAIAFAVPLIFNAPFKIALVLDVISSVLFIATLLKFRNTEFDPHLSKHSSSLRRRIIESVAFLWTKSIFPWNLAQILSLTCISGIAVISLGLSVHQKFFRSDLVYPATSMFYGLSLWVAGLILHKSKSPQKFAAICAALVFISAAMDLRLSPENPMTFIQFGLYIFGACGLIHATNFLILNCVEPIHSGQARSSMLFYLSIIFGFGELFIGKILHDGHLNSVVAMTRAALAFLLILGFLFGSKLTVRKR